MARRAEVALLFLVQEGRDTHAALDLGRRVEQRWPYYFSWRRLADAEDAEDVEEGRTQDKNLTTPTQRVGKKKKVKIKSEFKVEAEVEPKVESLVECSGIRN